MCLIDIYWAYHSKAEYTFFSNTHGSFTRIDNMLWEKVSLNKFEKIEIISSIFSNKKHCAVLCLFAQSCLTLWLHGPACQVHLSLGILQARLLERVVMPSSRGSSQPRNWTRVSYISGRFFTSCVTREAWSQHYEIINLLVGNVRVGSKGMLNAKELILSNCTAGEGSWVPWIAKRSNQSILKEINSEYSLEGLTLKLKL